MKRTTLLTGFGILIAYSGLVNAQTVPVHDHVVVVMMENRNYDELYKDVTDAPYINSWTSDANAAWFTNSFAIEHPSQPNYLDLFSGNNQGNTSDALPTNYPYTTANLGAELIAKGKTFTGFSENLGSVGSQAATAGGTNGYARKHAPWTNWLGAGTNQMPITVHQIYTSFPTSANYSTLPTVAFVIPNLLDDMHNGTAPTSIVTGDTWLKNNIDAYAQWAKTHNSLLIIQWDEDDNLGGTNQIVTIFIGQNVKGALYSEKVTHYRILRTLEDMYGTGYAGASSTEVPITDIWKSSTTGIASENGAEQHLVVMPNPFNNQALIRVDQNLQAAEFRLYNSLGEEVQCMRNLNGTQFTLNRAELKSGIYFYALNQGPGLVSRGKVMIE